MFRLPHTLAAIDHGRLCGSKTAFPLSLCLDASRHLSKACKTTPFPFLLDLCHAEYSFCPLCSRRSNRQTFPPLLSIAFSPYRMTDTRTHLCAPSDASQLVTALAPFTVVGECSNPAARAPESRSFFVASPAHFLLAFAPLASRTLWPFWLLLPFFPRRSNSQNTDGARWRCAT